jgi:hypothetical protein
MNRPPYVEVNMYRAAGPRCIVNMSFLRQLECLISLMIYIPSRKYIVLIWKNSRYYLYCHESVQSRSSSLYSLDRAHSRKVFHCSIKISTINANQNNPIIWNQFGTTIAISTIIRTIIGTTIRTTALTSWDHYSTTIETTLRTNCLGSTFWDQFWEIMAD